MTKSEDMYKLQRKKPPSWLDQWAETIKNNPEALEEYRKGRKEYEEQNRPKKNEG